MKNISYNFEKEIERIMFYIKNKTSWELVKKLINNQIKEANKYSEYQFLALELQKISKHNLYDEKVMHILTQNKLKISIINHNISFEKKVKSLWNLIKLFSMAWLPLSIMAIYIYLDKIESINLFLSSVGSFETALFSLLTLFPILITFLCLIIFNTLIEKISGDKINLIKIMEFIDKKPKKIVIFIMIFIMILIAFPLVIFNIKLPNLDNIPELYLLLIGFCLFLRFFIKNENVKNEEVDDKSLNILDVLTTIFFIIFYICFIWKSNLDFYLSNIGVRDNKNKIYLIKEEMAFTLSQTINNLKNNNNINKFNDNSYLSCGKIVWNIGDNYVYIPKNEQIFYQIPKDQILLIQRDDIYEECK